MITLTPRIRCLLFGILLSIICSAGCEYLAESTFTLANESRLPRWVKLPPGVTRADVSLTMSYYVKPWGRSAQFVLRDKNGQVLGKEHGSMTCKEPLQVRGRSQDPSADYPAYEAITVNGITDIIEHKKMEPIFFVTDNPAVWKQYESFGCRQAGGPGKLSESQHTRGRDGWPGQAL